MISLDDAFHFLLDTDIYSKIDIVTILSGFQLEFVGTHRTDPCRSTSDDLSILAAKHIIEILLYAVIGVIVLVDESHDIGKKRSILIVSLDVGFHTKPMKEGNPILGTLLIIFELEIFYLLGDERIRVRDDLHISVFLFVE